MEEWIKEFISYGALGGFAVFAGFVFWKKVLPWGDRYIASVEKLHDQLGEKIGTQQDLCAQHGARITKHDKAARDIALHQCKLLPFFI